MTSIEGGNVLRPPDTLRSIPIRWSIETLRPTFFAQAVALAWVTARQPTIFLNDIHVGTYMHVSPDPGVPAL